jgi:hypothetical protein
MSRTICLYAGDQLGGIGENNENRGQAVRDDRHGKTSCAREIDNSHHKPIERVLQLTRNTLTEMPTTEYATADDQTDDPCGPRKSQQSGNSVEQISAIDHLFAERRQRPASRDGNQRPLDIFMQRAKKLEIGRLAGPSHQQPL